MTNQNELKKERRKSFRKQLKDSLGGKCVVCGIEDDLDFDHIDPKTKIFNISWGVGAKTKNEVWAEVSKCQLLCRLHHEEKSQLEGSHPIGERHGRSKLREIDVLYLRGLSALGHSQRAIAREFGVSHVTVGDVLRGKFWAHVTVVESGWDG